MKEEESAVTLYTWIVTLLHMSSFVSSQAVPQSYTISSSEIVQVNGSTQDGHCNGAIPVNPEMVKCTKPQINSFLYDGVIPALTELDGSEWASGLLTLNTSVAYTRITFDFTNTPDYTGVESVRVVMFNCPQWEIGTSNIIILGIGDSSTEIKFGHIISPMLTSCDSLVSICTTTISTSLSIISLQFNLDDNSDLVYIAEVAFFSDADRMCEPDAILNPPTMPPTPLTTTSIMTTTSIVNTTPILTTTPIVTKTPIMTTASIVTTISIMTTTPIVTTTPTVATLSITKPTIITATFAALSIGLVCVAIIVFIFAVCRHVHAKKIVESNPIALTKHLSNHVSQKEELQLVRLDRNQSYEVVKLDRNPSYEVVQLDQNPSYEVVVVDPNPSYEEIGPIPDTFNDVVELPRTINTGV